MCCCCSSFSKWYLFVYFYDLICLFLLWSYLHNFAIDPVMWSTLFLLYLVSSVSSDDGYAETEIMPRCSDSPGTRMTFTPVEGYTERYSVELCTEKNRIFKEWELELRFYKTRDYCNASNPSRRLLSGERHSYNVEWVNSKYNCTSNQTVSF